MKLPEDSLLPQAAAVLAFTSDPLDFSPFFSLLFELESLLLELDLGESAEELLDVDFLFFEPSLFDEDFKP